MPSHYNMLAGNIPQQQVKPQDRFLQATAQLQQTKVAIATQQQKEGEDHFTRQMGVYKALVDAGAYNAANKYFSESIQPIAQNDDGQPIFPSVDLDTAGPEFHKQMINLWSKGIDSKTGRIKNRQALSEAAGRLTSEFPRGQARQPQVSPLDAGDEPEDDIIPGVTNQMVSDRAQEIMQALGVQPGSLESPADEQAFFDMALDELKTLTPDVLQIYTDQGYSEEQVKNLYRERNASK